ncbi:acetylornithine aminotransferase [Spirochaetia bacterium]|nr:acetylornithine aminotransferase [Spirochaetia bacterium]
MFMNTYHRLPVVFTHGQGAWLFDESGKKYLDWTSGIAVNCLGHNHPALVQAIAAQAGKVIHVSNYYQNDTTAVFAEELVAACAPAGMKTVFLANSGAEANEGACKIARKYSLKKYGTGRHTILTLKGSFHGRTITTLSATGQDQFHRDFGPFTEGFKFIQPGDVEGLNRAVDSTICAILIEVIQGESGIVPQDPAFVKEIARICAERDVLLIVDEIQSGMGRTGSFLACEAYGIKPDIVTLAKGLAGGIPVGAVLAGEKTADVLQPGDHGSTFGGNPVAAAAGRVVLKVLSDKEFLQDISRKGDLIQHGIRAWNHPAVQGIRGRGLMIGVDINRDARPVLEKALSQGVLILSAGKQTLRFLPPYIISDEEIATGLEILKDILSE